MLRWLTDSSGVRFLVDVGNIENNDRLEDGSVKILCQGRFFYIRFHYLEQVSNLSLLEKLSDAIVGEDGTLDKLEIPPEELLDKHFKVALHA